MPTQIRILAAILAMTLVLGVVACSSDDSDDTNPPTDPGGNTYQLTVRAAADFGDGKALTGQAAARKAARSMLACPEPAPLMDDPSLDAGLDCDEDGGVVTFTTPTSFEVAIKRLSFIRDDGTEVPIIADTGTLAASQVADLADPVTLFQDDLAPGTYTSVEIEFYYYEMAMDINHPAATELVRIYLSDDDFPAEGNLGHHQGDITICSEPGVEAGWVQGCVPWTLGQLLPNRGDLEGAGGTDPETGHLRGFFGNTDFWNAADNMQGSDQDIFTMRGDLDLVITDNARTVTFEFQLANTWFFEDFDGNQTFNPEQGGEACSANSEWAPLLPEVEITIQ